LSFASFDLQALPQPLDQNPYLKVCTKQPLRERQLLTHYRIYSIIDPLMIGKPDRWAVKEFASQIFIITNYCRLSETIR
jgi:hypothetical protein